MALSNKDLMSIENLDFDTIKEDLTTFLSGQDTFKDYNFNGSGLSILLDVLSYNTHQNAFYANMLANEAFLDSCLLRSSAVSLAKSLGYAPRSRRGAEISIDVELVYSGGNDDVFNGLILKAKSKQIKIIKNEIFTASSSSKVLYFYAVETVYFEHDQETNKIIARNVLVREGNIKTKTFVINDRYGIDQRLIIEDQNLDDRSVMVSVRKSLTENQGFEIPWEKAENILNLDSESRAYFLQEIYDGNYEIYFGDGVLGRNVSQGNVVVATYSSCSGLEGNGLGILDDSPLRPTFRYLRFQGGDAPGVSYVTSVPTDELGIKVISYGGSERETSTSIKYYAPKFYETQDRAVTINDYVSILQKNYSGSIRSLQAWGGQDNDPPEYGKVFISVKPVRNLFLTSQEKLNLENSILKEKNVVSVTPIIVDPEYLFITPKVSVKYNLKNIKTSTQTIRDAVNMYVTNFGLRNLSSFESNFYASSMINNILDLSEAIKSCSVSLEVFKRITPTFGTRRTYEVSFQNKLRKTKGTPTITSSSFQTYGNSPNALNLPSVTAYFSDDGDGTLVLYNASTNQVINQNFGTVDYEKGKLNIKPIAFLLPENLQTYQVTVTAMPEENDIISSRNTILELDIDGYTLTTQEVTN